MRAIPTAEDIARWARIPMEAYRGYCYACSATPNRWLCPFHRRFYSFHSSGRMVSRRPSDPCWFFLRTEHSVDPQRPRKIPTRP